MRNKKIIMLTVLFMFLLSSVCMAAYQPDPDRWVWIYSDDEIGYFYDKQTIRHYDYGNTCDVWIMKVKPAKKMYSVIRYIYKKNRTFTLMAFIDYDDKTGKVLDSYTYSHPEYEVIPPGTRAEVIYEHLFFRR